MALFGIGFSTVSAHFRARKGDLVALLSSLPPAVSSRRRKNSDPNGDPFGSPNPRSRSRAESATDGGFESLPAAGAASPEICSLAHQKWIATAAKAGIDLTEFDSSASLATRIAWARSIGLEIGTVLARFSSKLQHSTQAQVEDDVDFAAWHKIYVPPEFICVDEAVSGRKLWRDGLTRCKLILEKRLAQTLLVFKVSRLFRVAYRGYAFFQEEIVEEGLRAISVSQGIDTNHESWKKLAYLHGLMDEMLLETIADHVRSGLKSLAQMGFVTGPLTVGFRPVEVLGARPTNRGKPRTMPNVDPDAAKLILQHYIWIRDGMPIREGWRRWVDAGGPFDPRSTLGYMSCHAYRRMLSNPRYTGRFAFGRTRSVWSSKRDYAGKVLQPDTEVVVFQSEELRIVETELFLAVQQRLAVLKLGPRGPKKRKNCQLWDLLTDLFYCATCNVRFWYSGANGGSMSCKRGKLCPCHSNVNRKQAVQAVCAKLAQLLLRDGDLIENIVLRSREIDAQGDSQLLGQKAEIEKRQITLTNKINDLLELAGQGTEADRKTLKAKVRLAQSERADSEMKLTQVRKALGEGAVTITPERVREILTNLPALLEAGGSGTLGPDMVYHAASVFRRLVGDRIVVHVEARPGRQRTNVRAVFRANLLQAVQGMVGLTDSPDAESAAVDVWLREPPQLDRLAERAYRLVDVEGLSLRDAAIVFQSDGNPTINSGVVWQLRQRYYEMIGQPAPKRPYNNGRRRRSA